MKLEIEQMGIAETTMYARLEEQMGKFTRTNASAEFMKFLTDVGPKASMQIQTARLKRDSKHKRVKEMSLSAKLEVKRIKKQTRKATEDLKKVKDNFKLKEAASNRPQMSSERRSSVTENLLEARKAVGNAENDVVTTKHELRQAELMLEHGKFLESIVLRFCQSGEKRAKKFNVLKASIAESMEKTHMSKEVRNTRLMRCRRRRANHIQILNFALFQLRRSLIG